MVAENFGRALHNAWGTRRFEPGYCLRAVRTWLEIPALYHDARHAWDGVKTSDKRWSAPPPGAPVFFATPGLQGHVALSVGDGWVLSTDQPERGKVGLVTIASIEASWSAAELGWSVSLNGRLIPWLLGAEK
jgi:cell wall-associated NlpC family hydrolase